MLPDTSERTMDMKKNLFDLQLFGEGGGAGAGAGTGTGDGGAEGTASVAAEAADPSLGDKSKTVVYGKQSESVPEQESTADVEKPTAKSVKEDKTTTFEELIKGEYKDEFNQRTQKIIDQRFKATKGLEEKLNGMQPILDMLSQKYGVDGGDVEALVKAVQEDDSYYEHEALEKGLTVQQLKEMKALERENEAFRKAEQEMQQKAESEKITAEWLQQTEELKAKYGLENFNFYDEVNANPEFTAILRAGAGVEAAYMATHFGEILPNAMAKTADVVRQSVAQNVASRNSRPSENGLSSQTAVTVKADPSKWSKSDMKEVERRVRAGEKIYL